MILAMIVRDEAHTVERTLRSALPHIDGWCIADTGSTDGTQEVVRETLRDIPGELMEFPWPECFSTARNCVLDAIETSMVLDVQRRTSHVLWLDADDELTNGESLIFMLSVVTGDCFALHHEWSDGQTFDRPTVVRAGTLWRFEGRVHEVLRHPEGLQTSCLVGPRIIHTLSERAVAKSRARMPWDVEVLERTLRENPNDARAREYLQRTLASLQLKSAI